MTIAIGEEILPGDVYKAVHGRHEGMRVEVLKDRGHSVKVKVLNGGVANSGKGSMRGQTWTIPRGMFDVRYALDKAVMPKAPPPPTPDPVSEAIETIMRPQAEALIPGLTVKVYERPGKGWEAIARKDGHVRRFGGKTRQSILDKCLLWGAGQVIPPPGKDRAPLSPQARHAQITSSIQKIEALAEHEKAEVRTLWAAGEHLYELARAYRINPAALARWLGPRPSAPKEEVLAVQKLPDGAPLQLPAPRTPEATSTRRKKARGTAAAIRHRYESLTDKEKAAIRADRNGGMAWFDVMRKYHLINGTLSLVMRESNPVVRVCTLEDLEKGITMPSVNPEAVRTFTVHRIVTKTVEESVEVGGRDIADALVKASYDDGVVRVTGITEVAAG